VGCEVMMSQRASAEPPLKRLKQTLLRFSDVSCSRCVYYHKHYFHSSSFSHTTRREWVSDSVADIKVKDSYYDLSSAYKCNVQIASMHHEY